MACGEGMQLRAARSLAQACASATVAFRRGTPKGRRRQIWSVLALTLVAAAGHASAPDRTPANEERIHAVRAGRETTARASWWGFDPQDATPALQGAIDSGAPRVLVENLGAPWVVTPIFLASNQEIVFEKGVVVEAKRGAFKGKDESLFTARLRENVTLSGYGATLRMRKAEYQGPEYEAAEWRHALNLLSCRNIQVLGLTLEDSGGDGIYLGVGQRGVPCTDILIRDVLCDRNHRQGISVISAENLLMENCVLRGTSGTPPMAGIDFEPNEPGERIVNCVMRNCTVADNAGDGFALYLSPLKASSTPVSLRLENCRSIGNNRAFVLTTGNAPADAVSGTAEIIGCTFERSKGPALVLDSVPAGRWHLRFADCVLVDAALDGAAAPIVIQASNEATEPVGGMAFEQCLVRDPVERQPLQYQDWAGGLPVRQLGGTLIVERAGQRREIPLTEELLDQWLPTRQLKLIALWDDTGVCYRPLADPWDPARLAGTVRQRQTVRWLLWARQGDQVLLTVRSLQVGRYSGQAMPVAVVAPSGVPTSVGEVPFQQQATLAYAAAETGVHEVRCEPGANAVELVRTTHPICLTNGRVPLSLYATTGDLFFWVPGAVSEFGVKVLGDNADEGVRAALYDAADRLVGEKDDVAQPQQFVVNRDPTATGEVWRLALRPPTNMIMEDFRVQLLGVPPLLAPTREALLAPARN